MPMKNLRIGLVGFGKMGKEHARQISYLPSMEIALVVEPHAAHLESARAILSSGSTQFFTTLSSALETEGIDGWIITSSTKTHIAIAKELLEKGCIILLEKPIAITGLQASELREVVKTDSSNLMLGHILLWSREFQALQAEVEKRGGITSIHCSRLRPTSHRVEYLGESLFSLVMVHDLYCVQSLMQGAEPLSFAGETRHHVSEGDDLSIGQLQWQDSAIAILEANYFLPTSQFTQAIDEISVTGEGWYVKLAYESGLITVLDDAGLRTIRVRPFDEEGLDSFFDDALRNEIKHFGALIQGKLPVPSGAKYEDACQVQNWIDRLISSSTMREVQ